MESAAMGKRKQGVRDSASAYPAAPSHRVVFRTPGGGSDPARLRQTTLRLSLAIAAALLMAAIAAGPAQAVDTGHSFSYSFKPTGTAALGSSVPAVEVDNSAGPSAGDIYVADPNNDRVSKFDANGDFILMFGDEVNATTGGDVCTAASGNTCKAGTQGSTPQHVSNPQYLAVDFSAGASAGDVYVAETFPHVVRKFDENGNLETSWDGDGLLNGATAPGGPFNELHGIDTDSSGRLLVSWTQFGSGDNVFKFNQDGTYSSQFVTSTGDSGPGFAWTPGYVFRMRPCCEPVLRRSSEANGSGTVTISKDPWDLRFPRGLTADPSTGAVYQVMEDCCAPPLETPLIWEWQFDGSGQPLDAAGNPCPVTLTASGPGCEPTNDFGSDLLTRGNFAPGGIGVNSATDTVYVVDTNKRTVNGFVGSPAPIAFTEGPVGRYEVSGTAKPDGAGEIVECYFEFGETIDYGSKEECSPTPVGYNSDQAVTAELPGLNGDGQHTYHYRLVATNAAGATALGEDKTFRPQYVTGLETLPADNLQRTAATLKAEFDDIGEETKYYFEWGETTSYTDKSAVPPGPVAGSTSLSFDISGLKAQTTYHYRVVAENSLGITYGDDVTFKTLNAVQNLTTLAANPVERKSATLRASYVGDGTPTTWKFEWGKTNSYGNSTTVQGPESPSGSKEISIPLTGLDLETTYHFRVSATNGLDTTVGGDQSFTTFPAVSGLMTKPATEIGQDSITLNGEFVGNGEATNYYFEYGLTSAYGKVSHAAPGADAGSPTGATPLSAEIADYEAYETYHYRIVASNPFGVSYGSDMTFTALPAPLPTISGQAASNIDSTGATLEADINPNRWATVYTFEYGPSSEYGKSTEISSVIGEDQFFHPVQEEISNLAPGSVYHFRVVAINFTGTAYGPDQTFATPAAPEINLATASSIGESSARLSASVNPKSTPTGVRFEYGPTAAYGSSTATIPVGSGFTPQNVGADIGSLAGGTTYHFRVVAQNEHGTTVGSDQTFTTLPSSSVPQIAPTPEGCRKGFVKRSGKCVRKRCRKGFVKKRGKCVRKQKNRNSKRNRSANGRNG
jgi:hypothetical protein